MAAPAAVLGPAQCAQLQPQPIWIVAHAPGALRKSGSRQRRCVPLTQRLLSALTDAGLSHRVNEGNVHWWAESEGSQLGPSLHSLVLAKPGRSDSSCFDFEEHLLSCYSDRDIFTICVVESWIVCSGLNFMNSMKRHRDGSLINFHMNCSAGLLDRDMLHMEARRRMTQSTQCSREILLRWGFDPQVPVPFLLLADPFAALLEVDRWRTIAIEKRCFEKFV